MSIIIMDSIIRAKSFGEIPMPGIELHTCYIEYTIAFNSYGSFFI